MCLINAFSVKIAHLWVLFLGKVGFREHFQFSELLEWNLLFLYTYKDMHVLLFSKEALNWLWQWRKKNQHW